MHISRLIASTVFAGALVSANFLCPEDSEQPSSQTVDGVTYNYTVFCDTHFLGDEIIRSSSTGLEDCATKCSQQSASDGADCKTATFVSMTSECILRSTKGDIAQRPGLETVVA